MTRLFLRIYDALAHRRHLAFALLLVIMAAIGVQVSHIGYEEDIVKFLPGASSDQESIPSPSQGEGSLNSSPASTIAVIFSNRSLHPWGEEGGGLSEAEDALSYFADLAEDDPFISNLQVEADETKMLDYLETIYEQMPTLLTEADYRRMDSLLSTPGYIREQLEADKQALGSSVVTYYISLITQHDPLHLYTPVLQRLNDQRGQSSIQVVDGYLQSADGRHAIILFESPFGSSETARNAQLAAHLDTLMRQVEQAYEGIKLSAIGAPLIAVSNAQQIKTDATLAITIAAVLIFALLLWHYRRLSDIVWIGISLAFGFGVALAGTSLVFGKISIIVVGIASAVVGIAANYPLHFLDHYKHLRNRRNTLSEMVRPLLIGNITTVAAFFCLVFLDAPAMRHLGLFCSLMLMGTIIFVLVWLPHVMKSLPPTLSKRKGESDSLKRLPWNCTSPLFRKGLGGGFFLLTLIFGYFSLKTSFDSNLNHINYMTEQQRADMQLFMGEVPSHSMYGRPQGEDLHEKDEVATHDETSLWDTFWQQHDREAFLAQFRTEAEKAGFAEGAFDSFTESLFTEPSEKEGEYNTPSPSLLTPHSSLLSSFNYIGFVCGFVVFAFLWLSFRRIELALLSFLPLAVGWIWILGIMHLLGLQFNIVNIILATFIFGQGDDYTIFITEGLLYEYTHGRRRLDAYRRSVFLSAVIMLIGIGSLIVARHPALQSLALVTIVGMFVVVLMAFVLPPVVFRWLTMKRGERREVPITLKRIVYSLFSLMVFVVVMLLFMLPFTWVYFLVGKTNEHKKLRYHRIIQRMARFIVKRIPGVKLRYENLVNEDFERPAIIVSNHQSHFDLLCLMMLSPKMVFLTNDWVWRNPFYGMVIHKAEFYPVSNGIEHNMPRLRNLYERGYNICVFPEGTRSADCSILRFHKGAFYLARELGADVLPVFLHGPGHVLPKTDFMLREGTMTVEIGQRLRPYEQYDATDNSETDRLVTRHMRHYYQQHYAELSQRLEDETYRQTLRRYQTYYQLG